jgi:peptidyl-dipeptidase Dcp
MTFGHLQLKRPKWKRTKYRIYIKAEGGDFKLAPYDWRFYAEKIRKQKFDLDENEIKQYFSLENVHQEYLPLSKNYLA